MQKKRALHRFLLCLSAILLLTACEANTSFVVKEGGKASFELKLEDESGALKQAGITCNSLKEQIENKQDSALNGVIEVRDKSKDEELECEISMSSRNSAVDGKILRESGENYILKLDGSKQNNVSDEELNVLKLFNLDFVFTVQMPGKIVRAPGGEISGNKATFKDLSTVLKGIEVEGRKTADGSQIDALTPSKKAKSGDERTDHNALAKQENSHIFSAYIWNIVTISALAFIFLIAVTVLIAIIALLSRRNKDKNHTQNPYSSAFHDEYARKNFNNYRPDTNFQRNDVSFHENNASQEFFSAPAPVSTPTPAPTPASASLPSSPFTPNQNMHNDTKIVDPSKTAEEPHKGIADSKDQFRDS